MGKLPPHPCYESRAQRAQNLPPPPGEGRGEGTTMSLRDGRMSRRPGAETDFATHTFHHAGSRASP